MKYLPRRLQKLFFFHEKMFQRNRNVIDVHKKYEWKKKENKKKKEQGKESCCVTIHVIHVTLEHICAHSIVVVVVNCFLHEMLRVGFSLTVPTQVATAAAEAESQQQQSTRSKPAEAAAEAKHHKKSTRSKQNQKHVVFLCLCSELFPIIMANHSKSGLSHLHNRTRRSVYILTSGFTFYNDGTPVFWHSLSTCHEEVKLPSDYSPSNLGLHSPMSHIFRHSDLIGVGPSLYRGTLLPTGHIKLASILSHREAPARSIFHLVHFISHLASKIFIFTPAFSTISQMIRLLFPAQEHWHSSVTAIIDAFRVCTPLSSKGTSIYGHQYYEFHK